MFAKGRRRSLTNIAHPRTRSTYGLVMQVRWRAGALCGRKVGPHFSPTTTLAAHLFTGRRRCYPPSPRRGRAAVPRASEQPC